MAVGSKEKRAGKKNPAARAEKFLALMIQRGLDATPVDASGNLKIQGERLRLRKSEAVDLVSRGLAAWRDDGALVPEEAAYAWAKRRMSDLEHRAQHGDVIRPEKAGPAFDIAESPILWLYRRKDANGKRLIGDAMFAAGERLRSDFTFGNMMPRVTLNWNPAVATSRKPEGGEPSENALAARQRVRRALERVGPELSGVLIDVCCFLKRLEDVERDRAWPARSAKVILTLALSRLARHYGYSDVAEGRVARRA